MTEENDIKLLVRIYPDRMQMGFEAAKIASTKIIDLLTKRHYLSVIFAAAPSQNEFLATLVENTTIDWSRVNAFHMDEYIGLPEGDPRTFAAFLKEKIFGKLPFRSVNYINGNAADLQEECSRYAALLNEFSPDVICMGIGENGHLAFNDPPTADFKDPEKVKIVTLAPECRQQQVNDGCFGNLGQVPTSAITLTIPALMAGSYICCMVPGVNKAKAVFNTLNAEIIEQFPSTILRRHADVQLFLDADSGSLL